IGAGAGRFTEHLVRHAKFVVATDLSEAILVNAALGAENMVAAQIDLLRPPPMKVQFDVVFCRGVLQHTPDPKAAIVAIHRLAAPGALVVFDIYGPTGRLGNLEPKYAWRAIIPHLFSQDSFSRFLDKRARRLLRLRWRLKPIFRWKTQRLLDYLLPIADYKGGLPLSDDQLVEWGKLDTVDAMFAKYDKPMRYKDVVKALEEIGATIVASDHEFNMFKTQTRSAARSAEASAAHLH
ncbi:MAG: class I SAM-dependent methyltransferase, partial [Chloroflexi bacterium]|nr:class I SAM-dependent methyltransferase [Chloroflexota bacterium]